MSTKDWVEIKSIIPKMYNVKLTDTAVNLNENNYICDKYNYKAAKNVNLTEHNSCRHKILKNKCDQCSYLASKDTYITVHEGM